MTNLPTRYFVASAVTLLVTAVALKGAVAADAVKVFILAGQSNMQGQGVVSMDDPKNYNGGKGNLVWSMRQSASREAMEELLSE